MANRRARRQSAQSWNDAAGIFLRNIPAKCDHRTLREFLRAREVMDFELEMMSFPNGKSRGFAHVRCRDGPAMADFANKVHGQLIPGFGKPTPLTCEPLRAATERPAQREPLRAATERPAQASQAAISSVAVRGQWTPWLEPAGPAPSGPCASGSSWVNQLAVDLAQLEGQFRELQTTLESHSQEQHPVAAGHVQEVPPQVGACSHSPSPWMIVPQGAPQLGMTRPVQASQGASVQAPPLRGNGGGTTIFL